MSPKFGQPKKEETRVSRLTVSFTVSEREKLDKYCESKGVKLSELCREEVLKLVQKKSSEEEKELKKLRSAAKKLGLTISKGYLTERMTQKAVRRDDGSKIIGYTVSDSSNSYLEGLTSTEIYTMDFEQLKGFIENY